MGEVKPKSITVESKQWLKAEDAVNKYLDDAPADAWCEVYMRREGQRVLVLRVGHREAVFPENWKCCMACFETACVGAVTTTPRPAAKKATPTKTARGNTKSASVAAPKKTPAKQGVPASRKKA